MCDGTDAAACPGQCESDCTCPCTPVTDTNARISVTTKREAGMLATTFTIPLPGGYTNEPVTVRLDDTDSHPIVRQDVGPLQPTKGSKGKQFVFKAKSVGLRTVRLANLGPKNPGQFRVALRAHRWFSAADANQPAADTTLKVQIGNQCFSHVVTKKTD
jgi:hypothetical protein